MKRWFHWFCLCICCSAGSLMAQSDGQWGICEFATVSAMNAYDPGSDYWACKQAYVQASNASYFWDGSQWIQFVAANEAWISQSAKIFYPPSVLIDVSATGTGNTLNLYTQYQTAFATPDVASTGAPSAIPTFSASELYYYITDYDTSIFANVSIDANGLMTYDVIAVPPDNCTVLNIVFVVK